MSIIIKQRHILCNETTFCLASVETVRIIKKQSSEVDCDDEKTMPKGFAYSNNTLRLNEITICECLSINDRVCMSNVPVMTTVGINQVHSECSMRTLGCIMHYQGLHFLSNVLKLNKNVFLYTKENYEF